MKKNFILFFIIISLAVMLGACSSSKKESLEKTFEFRRKAIPTQVNNLVDDIGMTYIDPKAVMQNLDTFMRKNQRVKKVTLASLPLPEHPLAVSLAEVWQVAPAPIGKFTAKKNFTNSPDMSWYRRFLRKKIPYWYYTPVPLELSATMSYVYPAQKKTNPAVVLYILKLDFEKRDNPVLFWNVPKEVYRVELSKRDEKFIKEYLKLQKELEQNQEKLNEKQRIRQAEDFYNLKLEAYKEKREIRQKVIERLEKMEKK